MDTSPTKRVELVLPMRTVLIVAAAIGVGVAFTVIGETFLIVFVGIFLALVFEFPVRFVMAKTNMSRGLAATVTVLGTALAVTALALLLLVPLVGSVRDFLHDLPATVQQLQDSDELSWLGDSGAAGNVQEGAQQVSSVVPDAISAVLGDRGRLLLDLPRRLHDPLHLPVPAHRHRQPEASAWQRPHARRRRALAQRLGEGHGVRLALGDRGDHHRDDRRDDAGRDRVAARLELRHRAGGDRGAARHDPQPRRHDRRVHPRADALGGGGPHRRA